MNKFIFLLLPFTFIIFKVNGQSKLNIYGGKNHDVFLGCINCSEGDSESIWNIYGDYGSTHSTKSIWNEIGLYGSKKSKFSPFCNNAKYPPLLIDKKGKSYGYFTTNKNNPKRTWDSLGQMISENRDKIVDDIPYFYEHIFGTRNNN